MGADYDMGSNSRGKQANYVSQQSDIKAKAKAAYQAAEKETTIGGVVFDQGPLTKGITACDLGGRASTASNTEAKKNTSAVMSTHFWLRANVATGTTRDTLKPKPTSWQIAVSTSSRRNRSGSNRRSITWRKSPPLLDLQDVP